MDSRPAMPERTCVGGCLQQLSSLLAPRFAPEASLVLSSLLWPERIAPPHARRADGVIAVSRFTARQIVDRLAVPSERITVCSPGAPRWTPRTEHRSAGPILFVGTLEARKNVGTLLRAYGRVRAQVPS